MTTADHLVTSVPAERAKERASLPLNDRLALVRTRLAFERTLMAWVRTSVSLITFGFTLFKAVEYLRAHDATRTYALKDAKTLGFLMMAMGVIGLVLATLNHLRQAQKVHALDPEIPVLSVAAVVAVLFAAIGFWLLYRILAG